MNERSDDIEFDFFEDLEPAEPPSQERTMRMRRSGPPGDQPPGRRPRRGGDGPGGIAPLFRLGGLIAFAILVIVLLFLWIKSCQGGGKTASYRTYMTNVSENVVRPSTAISRDLNTNLTTPGLNQKELADELVGLAQREQQVLAQAQGIGPPGTLRSQHSDLLESISLRVGGLQGLADTFRRTAGTNDLSGTAILLAEQAQRLTASDVVWDDLFKARSEQELKNQGVGGVSVPDSQFVSNPSFSAPSYWEPIVERLSGASTGNGGQTGGLHGTALVSVKALPSEVELDPDVENTVTATTDLGFAVTVEDSGDSQEVQVKVTLTIQQQPTPIVKTQTIDSINPQEQVTLTFRNLGQVQFATKTVVKVDVKPVTGEANTANNSAEYPVIFSLG